MGSSAVSYCKQMKPGTRVRMRNVGGEWIEGTVLGPGPTSKVRPLDAALDEDIETAEVEWDDPVLGVDTVATQGLEALPSADSTESDAAS